MFLNLRIEKTRFSESHSPDQSQVLNTQLSTQLQDAQRELEALKQDGEM